MSTLVIDLVQDPAAAETLRARVPEAHVALGLDEIRSLGAWGTLRKVRRAPFDRSAVLVPEFRTPRPWLLMVLLALLPRASRRTMIDGRGAERPVSWGGLLASEVPFAFSRALASKRALRETRRSLRSIRPAGPKQPIDPRSVAFVRSDLGARLVAGGSQTHIAGVVGALRRSGRRCVLFTPAPVSGIEDPVVIPPRAEDAVSVETPHLAYNATQGPPLERSLRSGGFDLVYQRHALGAYAGALAAQAAGVPLVVEFNGSEVWIARNWGAAREHLDLFLEVERAVLRAADLVVAVSEPLRAQLRDLGVSDDRVLVNPNGVDADRFDRRSLAARRAEVRARLGADDGTLVTIFVGTFGPWHGAEVLARAARLLPEDVLRRMRLVFLGDGPRRAATEAIAPENAVFPGLVPADETPAWLAAADLAVSPHVPNADGSEFFGSPTKLFEYMAAGLPIVASRLGQIGETLRHGETGWLVPPGDERALADALERLAGDPALRTRLGDEAAREAREKHTWDAHVARILERLR